MGKKVLVTGAAGFIGSHLTERLVRDGHQVRVLVRYNGRDDRGHLDDLSPPVQDETRGLSRRPQGSRGRPLGRRRPCLGVPPRRPHRHPLLVPESARRRADQRGRDRSRAGRLPGLERDRAGGAHLDLRGLRHRAVRADRREASAPRAVALRRHQDRRRCARRELLPVVRPPRGHPPPVQHLRAPTVGPGHHPDDHQPGPHPPRREAGPASTPAAT